MELHALDCAFHDTDGPAASLLSSPPYSWLEANHAFYKTIAAEVLTEFPGAQPMPRLMCLKIIKALKEAK